MNFNKFSTKIGTPLTNCTAVTESLKLRLTIRQTVINLLN